MSGSHVLIPADVRFPLERANGVQVVKTAAALAAAGTHTTLLVRKSDPRPTEELLGLYGVSPSERLEVRRVDVGHRTGAFALPRARFLVRAGLAGWRALRARSVVFTRDLQLADLLLRASSGPLVYEAHAVEALMYRERGTIYGTNETPDPAKADRIAAREARVWRRAAGFVATTRGILESFAAAHGPRHRTRVIPNGTDVPAGRAFPGLSREAPPRILYAGQLYPWKGVDVLVRAMASVPDARLVILGGLRGEADERRITALVESCGLAGRTEMPGTVPPARVADELARASVVAAPFLHTAMSERHTSPLKAFEAMAAGRPLIASDLPASREVLRHE
ncbi:MAG TPA: glycosyltransferase, partial [Vicinamibacteria bacterium]|nr:glycosyltransferase [Vicinamibacteria bacterium]